MQIQAFLYAFDRIAGLLPDKACTWPFIAVEVQLTLGRLTGCGAGHTVMMRMTVWHSLEDNVSLVMNNVQTQAAEMQPER